jgi:glycosyltransferase involved in cell wall biosynthesis
MILGLLPAAGGGLRRLRETGQHTRLIGHYFRAYAAAFDHVHYFSYLNESFVGYGHYDELQPRVTVWPGREHVPYTLYGLLMPILRRDVMARCNVLRVFQATGALPAVMSRAAFRVPYVVTFGYRYADLATQQGRTVAALRLRLVERIAMRKAAAVIVTTADLASYVGSRVESTRVCLIPNGVDTERFAPDTYPAAGVAPVIAYVGRLVEEKGIDLLIDAVAGLDLPAQLLIVGDGPLRAHLQRQAARLGVTATFLGVVDHEALPSHLQRCSLFALPSPMEGQPKALIEAMACGLPCIASDCPGNRSLIIDGHNGLLFTPEDAERLRECLQRVLRDRDVAMRLGQEARRTVIREYDLTVLLEREVALLKNVAAQTLGG